MKKLFIIDLMPFLYKGHFVFLRSPRMTKSGLNTSALIGLVAGLSSIFKRYQPDYAVLAMDPEGKTFRHDYYAPYKAQREKMPEDLAANIPYAFELAEAMKLPVVRVPGFEADDVMGTLAVKGAAAGFEVYLVTPDKDAAQLVRENVWLFRPGKQGGDPEIYDEAGVCAHWGLTSPAQMIDYLALAGDASDNIPGVKGVGEKTAAQLLKDYGSVEGILAHSSELKGKLKDKIAAGAQDAEVSKYLTTIRTDVPIEVDWAAYARQGVDREKFRAVCGRYELNRFCQEVLGEAPAEVAAAGCGAEPRPLVSITSVPHTYTLVDTYEKAEALLKELTAEKTIAFDTETTGVNAHQCQLVGFSFATAPGKAWYVTGEFIDVFRPLFADPAKEFVGHNVKFDRTVLERYLIGFATTPHDSMLEHYCLDAAARHGMDGLSEQYLGYTPIPIEKLIGEKMRGVVQKSMAELAPAAICDYAAEDADVTLRLDAALRPLVATAAPRAIAVEEKLVKILIDMENEGVRIDVNALRDYGRALDREILSYMQGILAYADPGFNLDSPKQLGELLFEKLGLDPKASKKTQKGQWSTSEEVLQKLVNDHPVVPLILEYRACAKLKSTYVDKLPTLIDAHGRVHTTYAQCFTETGRLSSSDPNLQNIPIRTDRGKLIRAAFVPRDENHVIISADYSQIELRLMAAFSQDEAMLAAFARGEDIHRDTASRVFGIMPALVSPEQRSRCKMVNFGIIYGISAFGLAERLKVPRREAAELIDTYFKLYPKIRAYMQKAIDQARAKGYAETILGRRRTIRDISSRNATARQGGERDAINTPIQGSAADLIKVAMVRVDEALKAHGLKTRMVLQIHDELVFDAPKEEADEVVALVREAMEHALDFGVKLEVGIGVGRNWLEAH